MSNGTLCYVTRGARPACIIRGFQLIAYLDSLTFIDVQCCGSVFLLNSHYSVRLEKIGQKQART
jgi:hypothetical protein